MSINTTNTNTNTTTIPHEDEPQLEIDAGNGFSSVIALALHLPRHLEICQTYQEEDYCACTFTYSCPLCGKGVHKSRAATKFVGFPSNSKAKRVEYPGKLRLSLMFRPLLRTNLRRARLYCRTTLRVGSLHPSKTTGRIIVARKR
jgi:hypothetical protein